MNKPRATLKPTPSKPALGNSESSSRAGPSGRQGQADFEQRKRASNLSGETIRGATAVGTGEGGGKGARGGRGEGGGGDNQTHLHCAREQVRYGG